MRSSPYVNYRLTAALAIGVMAGFIASCGPKTKFAQSNHQADERGEAHDFDSDRPGSSSPAIAHNRWSTTQEVIGGDGSGTAEDEGGGQETGDSGETDRSGGDDDGGGVDIGGTDSSGGDDDGGGSDLEEDEFGCLKSIIPVKIVFVLDVTNSMKPHISAIKNNLVSLVNNIKSIKPNGAQETLSQVKIGLVEFQDDDIYAGRLSRPASDYRKTYSLKSDLTKAKADIGKAIDHVGNNEGNRETEEDGIKSVNAGLKMLKQSIADGDEAITIVVYVSDTIAHSGGSYSRYEIRRNYSTSSIKNTIKDPRFDRLYFYDSTPTYDVNLLTKNGSYTIATRPPTYVPAEQWAGVRRSWRSHRNLPEENGKSLGFPLSASYLIESLTNDLGSLEMCR